MTKSTEIRHWNMGIQGRMLRFIRELIGERRIKVRVGRSVSQSKQRLRKSTGKVA